MHIFHGLLRHASITKPPTAIFVLITAVLLVSGTSIIADDQQPIMRRYTINDKRELAWDGARSLHITGGNSSISLYPAKDNSINIKILKTGYAPGITIAKSIAPRIKVGLDLPSGEIRLFSEVPADIPQSARAGADYTGRVPADIPLFIQVATGEIYISGLKKNISIKNPNGYSEIIHKGDGRVTLETGKGAIKATLDTCSGTARSTSGAIDIKCYKTTPKSTLQLDTGRGHVTFELPPDSNATIDIIGDPSSVDVAGISMKEDETTESLRRYVLGDGESKITINCKEGKVKIVTLPPGETRGHPAGAPPPRGGRQ